MLEQLDSWFCNEDVNTAFDGILGDWVMRSVRGEDRNCQSPVSRLP